MSVNTSPQLYDEGEESWLVKLHLGCGGVYLRGYTNVDIDGQLATIKPYTAKCNSADVTDYYSRLNGDALHLPKRRETVVDLLCDITALPCPQDTVDKILAVQVFEHLSPVRAIEALAHWHSILRAGQPLVMSVPDMDGTLALFGDGRGSTDFALRHLRGRQDDEYQSHHAWYTLDTLCELVNYCGFDVNPIENWHFYPAVCVRAIKR